MRRPAEPLPFRLHASISCPPPATLALSLAWEFGALDLDRTERAVNALGATVLAAVDPDPAAQLRTLGDAVAGGILRAGDDGEILLDRVLDRGHGHPLAVAILLQELGRRAGLRVGIVGGASGHFVAHEHLSEPLVLDPATGRLEDANALGTLLWRCGHQIAAELLDLLEPRYERIGDLVRALHAARLRVTLPFEDTHDAEHRLRALIARLN